MDFRNQHKLQVLKKMGYANLPYSKLEIKLSWLFDQQREKLFDNSTDFSNTNIEYVYTGLYFVYNVARVNKYFTVYR